MAGLLISPRANRTFGFPWYNTFVMPIPWTAKRQLTYLGFLALIVTIALFFVWRSVTAPTCFDGKQNQDEEGVDCGGSCAPCLGEINDLITIWSKPFELENGRYDAAALVENPNLSLSLPFFKYKFKLYDANNILIALREGESFFNPGEQYVIFETDIDTGKRIPKKAFVEFQTNLDWKKLEKEDLTLIISKKGFVNEPYPRLSIEIENKSLFPVKDVRSAAVLYDENKNAVAVSTTVIDSIGGESLHPVVFMWPQSFEEQPSSSEIFLRTGL